MSDLQHDVTSAFDQAREIDRAERDSATSAEIDRIERLSRALAASRPQR
ncbi:hypothetical protein [Jatrophihabitans sp.]|nr:hypothetical protein [Jatrophihabitans sp.]